jgi:hypothetical protein
MSCASVPKLARHLMSYYRYACWAGHLCGDLIGDDALENLRENLLGTCITACVS